MATVRFSQELKDAILRNAKNVFNRQVEEATNSRPSHEWGVKIYDTLFGMHTPALNAVPREFLKFTKHVSVDHVGDKHCNLKFELPTERPWPHEFVETELAKKAGYYGEEIHLKNHLLWGELFAEITAWRERINAANSKRNAFVDQVAQIIGAHATLAPALKMWPPLWDLVPENYKEKHREVKERVVNKPELQGVDLGSMTAAVVANKLIK